MLCPSCNKFAAYETSAEPEIEDLDITAQVDGETKDVTVDISGSARIVLTSECCGDELKEATFDIDVSLDVEKASDCTCGDAWMDDLEAEADGPELTDRQESSKPKTYKTGPKKGQTIQVPIPYRYQRRYFGVETRIAVNCGCGKEIGSVDFKDEIQASGMDEL